MAAKSERAVKRGDLKELRRELKDLTHNQKCDLLIRAAQDDQYDVLKLLLSDSADPNYVDKWGRAALEVGLFYQASPRVINRLISGGANIQGSGRRLHVPLCSAAKGENIPGVRRMLDAGASVDAQDSSGLTALQYACKAGNTELIRILISAGANVNPMGKFTPIVNVLSAKSDLLEAVRLLLDAGADVRRDSLRCAHFAALQSHNCLLAVLAAGAPVNTKNHHDQTELHEVANIGLRHRPGSTRDEVRRIINTLVAAGCDPNGRSQEGMAPLHMAAEVITYAIAPLIECGAHLDVRDKFGNTALHVAVATACTPNIEELIYAGSDATIANEKGLTPLQLAQSRPSCFAALSPRPRKLL